jgi:predicted transposase YbfD/YdcC
VLGQQAVEGKSNELTAIPVLLKRLAEKAGLRGALVSIDAIATNAKIAQTITDADADYRLAVKASQPTLRAEIQSAFVAAGPDALQTCVDFDKGHGRIEQRTVSVLKDVEWLNGDRRFPGEHRFPGAATIIRVQSRAELSGRSRFETRYYISSAALTASTAAAAGRAHWGVENSLHWILDVDFHEDQSRLRKGHGAQNMAVVRHFAINLARSAKDKRSIKLRRKAAGWDASYLASMLGASAR